MEQDKKNVNHMVEWSEGVVIKIGIKQLEGNLWAL